MKSSDPGLLMSLQCYVVPQKLTSCQREQLLGFSLLVPFYSYEDFPPTETF